MESFMVERKTYTNFQSPLVTKLKTWLLTVVAAVVGVIRTTRRQQSWRGHLQAYLLQFLWKYLKVCIGHSVKRYRIREKNFFFFSTLYECGLN
uniref:Uncharacterized protein n=1 Tax=Glossina palpalis gambiensis TaxID=67801 RepID=A0A1B0B170_9MUSC